MTLSGFMKKVEICLTSWYVLHYLEIITLGSTCLFALKKMLVSETHRITWPPLLLPELLMVESSNYTIEKTDFNTCGLNEWTFGS